MDYKEKAKAKRYDEAIERARKLKKDPQSVFNEYSPKEGDTISDYIFPELKESEDERVRKNLIGYIKGISKNEVCEETKNSWIAWLEKQGEQKPSNDAIEESDFFDDFRKSDVEIDSNEDGLIAETIKYKKEKHGEQKHADKVEPKFNIGDTIAKKHNSDIHDFGSFTITDITGGKYWYNDRIICDITEQDGWEIYEPVRQKQEWSKDDEYYRNIIMYCLNGECVGNADKENAVLWLKSLRPQNKWKPNDEQMLAINTAINVLGKGTLNGKQLIELREELQKLREE